MKKYNQGFTLVELIGVIVLLSAIILIVVPIVDKTIKNGKNDIYQKQIESIESSAQLWYVENKITLVNNESMVILLSQLKQSNLVDLNIENSKTKSFFPNDMQIMIKNVEGQIIYDVLEDTGRDKSTYDKNVPSIVLNGNALEYLQLDKTGVNMYKDPGALAHDINGNILSVNTTISPNDISSIQKGIYTITYLVSNNNLINRVNRTVIVKDTKGPDISFPEEMLSVTLEQANTYAYKGDLTISDNSNDEITIKVEYNFGGMVGVHTIKYIATDESLNETIKLRKINITN